MEILFLGTGAADYNFETDRNNPGYRRNSSILIDGTILVDPGPCVLDAIEEFGVDAGSIKYIIVTHTHEDHYNEETVKWLEDRGAKLVDIPCEVETDLGNHRITAYAGNHTIPVKHYIVECDGSRLFYGLDSAWLMYSEVQAIKEKGVDVAVLDGTIGFVDGDRRIFEHCNMNMIIEIQKSLKESVGKFYISHMAKTLHTDHDTLSDAMDKYDIGVAYDGMEINI